MDGCMHGWIIVCMAHGWVDAQMDGWMDRQVHGPEYLDGCLTSNIMVPMGSHPEGLLSLAWPSLASGVGGHLTLL